MPKTKDGHTEKTWIIVEEIIVMILESDLLFKNEFHNCFVNEVMEKFDVSERTAHRYIAEAKKKVRKLKSEIAKAKVEYHFTKAILDREWVIREAKNQKDLGKALDGMKDREKLLDIYPDQKIKNENINYDIDLSKFTEKGLERIKRGDDPQVVLLDPESIKIAK